MSILIDPARLSGVKRSSTYLAMRSTQGGRTVYSLRVPLADLSVILPVPNPEEPDPDNRKVDRRHAKDFGDYLHKKVDWVAPALLARDNGGCKFDEIQGAPEGRLGYLEIPWSVGALSPLSTIDGQHRILGVDIEIKSLTEQINKINKDIERARSEDRLAQLRQQRDDLLQRLQRMDTEYVGLDIYLEPDNIRSRQMFVDVADNAKGISSALRSRFDGSKIANRTLDRVMDHALLKGRVDLEQDRMTAKNPNLMGAKHVADLTRAVAVGVAGRIGKKRETELDDAAVTEAVHKFLECITEAFTDLAAVADGRLSPLQLRQQSLLGSVGTLRVLAGAYHVFTEEMDLDDEDIIEFFRRLNPHMNAPVTSTSLWRTTAASADFEINASAPVMRTQNLQHLVNVVTGWYKNPPTSL
ncbi:DNA sulfur modification protein DndB [Micromonospora sp. NPDC047670]|uniref:DNA sulfur modification protein DndB n=1 Tax=Micromonospora sp. NPDC047670 TaxID=3364252 RepID=UPI0037191A81